MGGGLTILSIYNLASLKRAEAASILLTIALIVFMADFARLKFPRFNNFALGLLSPFMREEEKNSVSGMPFYALGTGLSFLFFSEKIAILSILFLTFSDPISSLVGVTMGKNKILPNKSFEGSMAGAIICFLISFAGLSFWGADVDLKLVNFCLMAGILGSFSELLSALNADDNLTIPVFSGLGLLVLENIFNLGLLL